MNTNDSFTTVIEVLIRNAHLGVLLKASLFPASDEENLAMADGVFYSLFVYSLIVMVIAGLEVVAKFRGWGPVFRQQKSSPRADQDPPIK